MINIVYKKSKQRERILEILENTDIHPAADWIYEKLKKDFKNLSLGTVYRNLNILIDQGKIQKIDFGSTFDRFDAKTDQHYHLVCQSCNSILDLDIPVDNKIFQDVQKKTDFKVKSYRLEFFGLCINCIT